MAASPGHEALELMAQNEVTIATLYERFAQLLPGWSDFWQGLAEEERRHAAVIDSIKDRATGSLPGRFKPEAVRAFTDYVGTYLETQGEAITPETALATAQNIETGLIERRFFEQLPQDDPEVSGTLSSLKKETEAHVRRVRDALSRTDAPRNHSPG